MDLVSIIIPNYNREDLVVETVQNMLDQDYPNKEIIVVDDGSTDNSIHRLQKFGESITVLTQKNQGPGAARNHGLSKAKGNFIQLMDSDDLASKNKISSQVKSLKEKSADAVYSPWAKFDIQGKSLKLEGAVLQSKPLPPSDLIYALLNDWSTLLQIFLFRKDFLDKVGALRTDVNYLEDIEYIVRIILNDAKIVYAEDPITLYRNDSLNKLSNACESVVSQCKAEALYFNSFVGHLKEYSPEKLDYYSKYLAVHMARIYNTLKDEEEFLAPLEDFLSLEHAFPPKWKLIFRGQFLLWKKRIKQRVYGWRWSNFYFPAKINQTQIKLIGDLGYNIENT